MPVPLQSRIDFNVRYNDDGSGGPWTVAGRDYVVDEIWRPLESFRAWPRPGTEVCDACRARVGQFVTSPIAAHGTCAGLDARPLVVVAVNLPRRSGKTINALAYALSAIFLEKNKRIAYVAAAEDQAAELVAGNLAAKIERHESLAGLARLTAAKIEVPKKNSWLEVLPASHASVTGRGYTLIIVDEARDLGARVFAALVPSIFASHGLECPYGHGHWQVSNQGQAPPTSCPACGSQLQRWFARLLVMSASGITEDNAEKDWFDDFITKRLEKPHPSVHVFRTDRKVNPSVSSELVDAVSEAFADVPGLVDYMAVEVGNKSVRKGEVYLKKPEIDAIVDHRLFDFPSSAKPAVGFVDTSRTGDKTSLVICVDDSASGEPPFHRLALQHVKVWNPRDRSTCPDGVVNETKVEAYLDQVIPSFPSLLKLKVDTRVMPWAKQLVANCLRKPWGVRIEGFEGNSLADSAMYLELLQRVVGKTIRIFPHDELQAELLALRKQDLPKGGIKVYDAGSGKDGRNRRVGGIHRDIAMSLAACCLLAAELRLAMPEQLSSVDELDREFEDLMPKPIMRDLARGGF